MRASFDSVIWMVIFLISMFVYYFKTQGITVNFFSFIIIYLYTVSYIYIFFTIFLLTLFLIVFYFAKNEKEILCDLEKKFSFDDNFLKELYLDKIQLFVFLFLIIFFEATHYFYNFYLPFDIYLPFVWLLLSNLCIMKLKKLIKNTYLR